MAQCELTTEASTFLWSSIMEASLGAPSPSPCHWSILFFLWFSRFLRFSRTLLLSLVLRYLSGHLVFHVASLSFLPFSSSLSCVWPWRSSIILLPSVIITGREFLGPSSSSLPERYLAGLNILCKQQSLRSGLLSLTVSLYFGLLWLL